MLLKFGLRNFKAFRDQAFDLAPITVFVGRNGTGKSSVLQALAFLKQSSLAGEALYAGRDGAPALADLGSFEEVVHGGDADLPVDITLEARLDALGPTPWPTVRHLRGLAAEEWKRIVGKYPVSLDYRCALMSESPPDEVVMVQPKDAPRIQARIDLASGEESAGARRREIRPSRLRPFHGFDSELINGGSPISSSLSKEAGLTEDVARLGKSLRIQLQRFFFIPAGRGFMGQAFPLRNDTHGDLAAAGHDDFSSNAATALAKNRRMEEQVSDWLETVTGLRIRSQLTHTGTEWGVSIVFQPPRDANGRMPVGANNESFGANQLSQVFLQIALAANDPMVRNEATIGIEEPEVHLHPRAQRNFVEMLAAIAKQGTQFIISTHSDRIVSRVLLLVAKGVLRREDVAVYAFDKDEHGVASAELREIDEMGRIRGGLPGFMDEDLKDMDELLSILSEHVA